MTAFDGTAFAVDDPLVEALVDIHGDVLDTGSTIVGVHPIPNGKGRLVARVVGAYDERLPRPESAILTVGRDPQYEPCCRVTGDGD